MSQIQKAIASTIELMKANDVLYADLSELGAEYRDLLSKAYGIQIKIEEIQIAIKERGEPRQLNG